MDALPHPAIRLLAVHGAPLDDSWFTESRNPEGAWCSVLDVASLGAGIDALTTEGSVEAVVIDQHLLEAPSWEALARIRGANPDMPIVAIASDRAPEVVERAIRAGADHVFYREEITGALLAYAVRYSLAKRRAETAERLAAVATAEAKLGEQFVAVLAHDLRSPLSSIVIGIGLILKQAGIDERQAKAATRIARSADRMNRMITDLLDLARIRMGEGYALKRQRASLTEISQHVVEEIQPTVASRVLSFAPNGPAWGQWDSGHMARLVSNLVVNGLNASPVDTPVRIAIREETHAVVLEINHRGPRIPPEDLPTIFEPFAAMKGTEKREPIAGLGLGLYIAQQIALAHEGTLVVRSLEDEGTTFTARFPIYE